jgi:hypothetical protein
MHDAISKAHMTGTCEPQRGSHAHLQAQDSSAQRNKHSLYDWQLQTLKSRTLQAQTAMHDQAPTATHTEQRVARTHRSRTHNTCSNLSCFIRCYVPCAL